MIGNGNEEPPIVLFCRQDHLRVTFKPVVVKIAEGMSPREALRRLADLPYCLLLESSLRNEVLGRYSFLAADPVEVQVLTAPTTNPLAAVQASLDQWKTERVPGLPPFQGGWAGLLGYDLGQSFEVLPQIPNGAVKIPVLCLGLYDVVFAWDHLHDKCWLISQGVPETEPSHRKKRAEARASQFLERLTSAPSRRAVQPPSKRLPIPSGFSALDGGCFSNFSQENYLTAVRQAVELIRAGDIFQANLSQQILLEANCDSLGLYDRLAESNPSTFSGWFDGGDFQVVSSSPERLFQLRGQEIETRPIKGTRRRTKIPMVDISVIRELETNEKERAENTMIVDLMRNDFSRICEDDSVLVTQWCGVESYESVFHLVSAIRGRIRPEVTATEIIPAVFPGGSVTGAPKIRAMEVIAELEGCSRGAYCGSLGYFGLSGDCDFNILIRTVTAQSGWWQLPVGGAIVADSKPEQEYAETWTKAAAVLRACWRNSAPPEPPATPLVEKDDSLIVEESR
jgi:para-aminobenzoate synthetase component I